MKTNASNGQTAISHFAELAAINVNSHVEKKGKLSYLSWTWAIDQLLRNDPGATWEYGEPQKWGDTVMVFCTVTAFGQPRTMQLPVMNNLNKAIPNPDAFAVNTAMQRCLVKAIALHGIGLYIYAGEDLPPGGEAEPESEEEQAAHAATLQSLRDAALNGTDALKTAWKALPEDTRTRMAPELPSLKKAAAEVVRPANA
jgi:hypothetical protein